MGFAYVVFTYGFLSSLGVGLAYVAPLAAGMKVHYYFYFIILVSIPIFIYRFYYSGSQNGKDLSMVLL